jgi:CheY-like chemotaxis protein
MLQIASALDDETDARSLFAKVLSARGAKVRTAASMDEALAMIDAGVPDVLVSDIAMPDGDGYMLIRTSSRY